MNEVRLLSDEAENGIRTLYFETAMAVCSQQIGIALEGDVVKEVRFAGGCSGNLQGIGSLVRGMKVADVIDRLAGLDCRGKGTSCPDQLAKALKTALETYA